MSRSRPGQGEVFGIAGLVGSGRTELLRAIFGADRADSATVSLEESGEPCRYRSPRDAVRAGLALIPGDRKRNGLLLGHPVRVNLALGKMKELTTLAGWIDAEEEVVEAERTRELMHVHADGDRAQWRQSAEVFGGRVRALVVEHLSEGSVDVQLVLVQRFGDHVRPPRRHLVLGNEMPTWRNSVGQP